jgi:hypothetical protein
MRAVALLVAALTALVGVAGEWACL